MKVAIYSRESIVDENPDVQIEAIRNFCKIKEHEIVAEFIDRRDAAAPRSELERLLEACKSREFNGVVCWRLDRIGASLAILVDILDYVRSLNKSFMSVSEDLEIDCDFIVPGRERSMSVLIRALAESERVRHTERICEGIAAARTRGARFGRARKSQDPVDVQEREVLRLRTAKKSMRAIAKELNMGLGTVCAICKKRKNENEEAGLP